MFAIAQMVFIVNVGEPNHLAHAEVVAIDNAPIFVVRLRDGSVAELHEDHLMAESDLDMFDEYARRIFARERLVNGCKALGCDVDVPVECSLFDMKVALRGLEKDRGKAPLAGLRSDITVILGI